MELSFQSLLLLSAVLRPQNIPSSTLQSLLYFWGCKHFWGCKNKPQSLAERMPFALVLEAPVSQPNVRVSLTYQDTGLLLRYWIF